MLIYTSPRTLRLHLSVLEKVQQVQAAGAHEHGAGGQEQVRRVLRVHLFGLLEHPHQQDHHDDVAQLGLEVVQAVDREPRGALLLRKAWVLRGMVRKGSRRLFLTNLGVE